MKKPSKDLKLIAEFLGYSQPHPKFPNSSYWYKENEETLALLRFNEDWNWLMKVVQKIESLGYCVEIKRISCRIYPLLEEDNLISAYVCGDLSKKINIVYSAVIGFIKFYNEKKN